MKKIYETVFILVLLHGSFLYSQTENEDTVYVIRDITYNINGKTKENALERVGEFRTGLRFSDRDSLEEYIKEKNQDILNLRTFEADTSAITYSLGDAEEDGTVPVYLEVSVTDSSSFLIVPEPKYDSNNGFTFSLKLRESNFLGTLAPQKIDFVWGNDDKERNHIGYLIDLIIPFRAFGLNWTLDSYNEFRYYLSGEPAYNTNVLGIATELPVSFTTFNFGFEQGVVIHEENTEKAQVYDSGEYNDWFLFSSLHVDWKIPTPLKVGKFGQITYTPGVYGIAKYQPGGDPGAYRRGPSIGAKQDIGFGRIDWIGNFRNGLKVSLLNDNEYNFSRREWINSIGFLGEGHLRISKFFGISGRLMYTKWFNDYYEYAGDVLRGYKDIELDAKERLSLNLDFPFRLIRFVPSEWTGNRKYRFFDFEQHWSFFSDFIMADSPLAGYSFKPGDIITGMGIEIITFPLAWRSFYIRISAGWNIREWARTGKMPSGIYRELFVGMGHYY